MIDWNKLQNYLQYYKKKTHLIKAIGFFANLYSRPIENIWCQKFADIISKTPYTLLSKKDKNVPLIKVEQWKLLLDKHNSHKQNLYH